MLDTTQFSNDVLSLADTHKLNEFDISSLIEKYTAGREIFEQQEIRRQMLAELQSLKAAGLIEYNEDHAREIKGMSAQVFRRNSLTTKGTRKRLAEVEGKKAVKTMPKWKTKEFWIEETLKYGFKVALAAAGTYLLWRLGCNNEKDKKPNKQEVSHQTSQIGKIGKKDTVAH